MPALINWELVRTPYNWLIIPLMILLGTAILFFLTGGESQSNLAPASQPLSVV
jgi:hypothetical protein